MKTFFIYIILNALMMILFWGVYKLVFLKRKSSSEQRIFLLMATILSIVIPIVNIPGLSPNISLLATEKHISNLTFPTKTIVYEENVDIITTILAFLIITYFFVVLLKFTIFFHNQYVIRKKINTVPFQEHDGIRYHFNSLDENSYSYKRDIVIGIKGLNDNEIRMITLHEESHVRHRHTFDILLMSIVKTVFWCDPMNRIYTAELKKLHDYIADIEASSLTNTQEYTTLLLSQCRKNSLSRQIITCNFKSGDFMARIKNVYSKENHMPIRFLSIIPVIALALFLNSCANPIDSAEKQKLTMGNDTIQADLQTAVTDDTTITEPNSNTVEIITKKGKTEVEINGNSHELVFRDSSIRLTITSSNPNIPITLETEEAITKVISGIIITSTSSYIDSTESDSK